MAETLKNYPPGESNKLGHVIRRTHKESKQQDVYFTSCKCYFFSAKESMWGYDDGYGDVKHIVKI